ncbi:hypothetical protein Vi05172_g11816 [Venturia inaequalis]|nr:hypothetical protein Vi05172_g11816 [Venturia inaequalis]
MGIQVAPAPNWNWTKQTPNPPYSIFHSTSLIFRGYPPFSWFYQFGSFFWYTVPVPGRILSLLTLVILTYIWYLIKNFLPQWYPWPTILPAQNNDQNNTLPKDGHDANHVVPDGGEIIEEEIDALLARISATKKERAKKEAADAKELARAKKDAERAKANAKWATNCIFYLVAILFVILVVITSPLNFQPALVGRDLDTFRQETEVSENIRSVKGCARVLSTSTSHEVATGQHLFDTSRTGFPEKPKLYEILERFRTAIIKATDLAVKGGSVDLICNRTNLKTHHAFNQARLQLYQRQPDDFVVKPAERPPNFLNSTIQFRGEPSVSWLQDIMVSTYYNIINNKEDGLPALLKALPDERFRDSPCDNPDKIISTWRTVLNDISSQYRSSYKNLRLSEPKTKLVIELRRVFKPENGAFATARLYAENLLAFRADVAATLKSLQDRHHSFLDPKGEGGRLQSCSRWWEKKGCLLYYDHMLIEDYKRVAGWICGKYEVRTVRIKRDNGIAVNDAHNTTSSAGGGNISTPDGSLGLSPVGNARLGSEDPYTTLEIVTEQAFDSNRNFLDGLWAARNGKSGYSYGNFDCEALTMRFFWVNGTSPFESYEDRLWRSKDKNIGLVRQEHDARKHPEEYGC